ncbi:MAG: SMP-30/gluconolactonase/LRE family protein [Clostridia bacterium]|nr:SMP-30/gluconolactonase/LRE family protein [Clostridia bacterium]
MMQAELFNNIRCIVGEGPVWDAEKNRMLFLDIRGQKIISVERPTGKEETIHLPQRIGCFALCEKGGLIAGLTDGVYFINEDNTLSLAHLPVKIKGDRFNDGKIGPDGAFYLGTSASDGKGAFYRLKNGVLAELFDGVTCSNGLDWTEDGTRMYYIDTPRQMIEMFDFDVACGTLSNRRKFMDIPKTWGLPDGMTKDRDDHLWVALWDGGSVIQIDKNTKQVINRIDLPCPRASCPAFGGDHGEELFITTAAFGNEQNESAGKTYKIKTVARGGTVYKYREEIV